ncbi:MAG TPA: hypothetical protein DEP72_04355 [Clostridiales bacterium]|nr:MAG: hypothetical protein A2Y18_04765 [Clostridiales bacterium GWD2_32_19]HCC07373.1 hypothetical protein [Clostridiales bacterium]
MYSGENKEKEFGLIMIEIVMMFIGFGAGAAIGLAVTAFIISVGIITKMVNVTGTKKYNNLYQNMILIGITTGTLAMIIDINFHINEVWLGILGFFSGVFVGIVAISLVEIINVLPVIKERIRIRTGLVYVVISIALGKMVGSIIYWTVMK